MQHKSSITELNKIEEDDFEKWLEFSLKETVEISQLRVEGA